MTTEIKTQHCTPAALDQAVHLADQLLPKTSLCFEKISAETALEVAEHLREHKLSQDDQLAALLWLFPDDEIQRLAPSYLMPAISYMPKFWKEILAKLDSRECDTSIDTVIEQAPPLACTIASAYLYILNEHGRRQIYQAPDHLAQPLCVKQFLANFFDLAKKLSQKVPYMTAERLVGSVGYSIDLAALTDDLWPETTWVWEIRLKTHSGNVPADSLKMLKTVIRKLWLTTGSYPDDHALAQEVFFVQIKKDSLQTQCVIERLMTSLALRFSFLFDIHKVRFSAEMKACTWNKVGIYSWGQGMCYSGRHQQLLKCNAADPFSRFVEYIPCTTSETQYQSLKTMCSEGHIFGSL